MGGTIRFYEKPHFFFYFIVFFFVFVVVVVVVVVVGSGWVFKDVFSFFWGGQNYPQEI